MLLIEPKPMDSNKPMIKDKITFIKVEVNGVIIGIIVKRIILNAKLPIIDNQVLLFPIQLIKTNIGTKTKTRIIFESKHIIML